MIFNISNSTLLSVLQNTSRVIASKPSMPILENFLFVLKDNILTITATDLESTIISRLEVDSSEGEGVAAISAVTIIEVLRELGEQPIRFSIDLESFEVRVEWLTGGVSIVGADGSVYPEITDTNSGKESEITLTSEELLTGISQTIFAVSNSDTRPTLNGVLLDISAEKVVFVGTDAHQLVKMSIDKKTSFEDGAMVIIPKKSAYLLKSILTKSSDEVKIEFSSKDVKFTVGSYTYMGRLIEGRFPNYNVVIPKNNPNKVTVNRLQLLSSVKRVAVCSNKANNLIRLIITEDKINLEARDLDYSSSAKDNVNCTFTGYGINCAIGMKSRNIIDMLSSISSEDVSIEFTDPTKAIVFIPLDSENELEKSVVMMTMPVNA